MDTEYCADTMGDSRDEISLEIERCHGEGGNQMFMLVSDTGEFREKKLCMDATGPGEPVNLLNCHGNGGNQFWKYDKDVSYCARDAFNNQLPMNLCYWFLFPRRWKSNMDYLAWIA